MELHSTYELSSEQLSVGNEVYIAIRHERILIGNKADGITNLFPCKVNEIMYLGEGTQFIISTDHGHRLLAINKTDNRLMNINVGDEVYFRIDPKDVKVIRCFEEDLDDQKETY